MEKKPAKIRAIVEIEFDAHTTNRNELAQMVQDKLQTGVKSTSKTVQFHIKDHGTTTKIVTKQSITKSIIRYTYSIL